jgi:hypothetical protein
MGKSKLKDLELMGDIALSFHMAMLGGISVPPIPLGLSPSPSRLGRRILRERGYEDGDDELEGTIGSGSSSAIIVEVEGDEGVRDEERANEANEVGSGWRGEEETESTISRSECADCVDGGGVVLERVLVRLEGGEEGILYYLNLFIWWRFYCLCSRSRGGREGTCPDGSFRPSMGCGGDHYGRRDI